MSPRVVCELDAEVDLVSGGSRKFRVIQVMEQHFQIEQFIETDSRWETARIAKPFADTLPGALQQLFAGRIGPVTE